MPFPRVSTLTGDALYPITFRDMLAFHGSYLMASTLQTGRALVGSQETNFTVLFSLFLSTLLPLALLSFHPCIRQYHKILSHIARATSHLISLEFPPACLLSLDFSLSKPSRPTTSVLTSKICPGPLLPLASSSFSSLQP